METIVQNIIEPIKNNKGLKIVFAANYPVTFQMDEDKLYPMFYEQDTEKIVHEIPNLFVFAADYPHFAITTQAGIQNLIEKQQDFILEEVDNSKYTIIPLTEFLNNTEQDSDLNPVSFVKTLVLEASNAIVNQFFWQHFDDENEWTAVKNPDTDWKYISTVSNRINSLCELA